jgi:hypothetical protein
VSDWQSEDEIKSQLRALTAQTRKLRRDLDDMIRGAETKPERRYLHKQSWPKSRPAAVNDRRKKKAGR